MAKPWVHVEYSRDEPAFLDAYFTIGGGKITAVRVRVDVSTGKVRTQTFTDEGEGELAPFDVERMTSGDAMIVRPCVVEALREVDR